MTARDRFRVGRDGVGGRAHAAAPAHVSALMSGVLIKMGILGCVRLLSWIAVPPLWLGDCLAIL